jgi:hypothetical protein
MIHQMATPTEVGNPIYESLVYVHGGDRAVSERVTEQIRNTVETMKERVAGTVVVVFYRIRPASGWFSKEERIEVEKWRIPVQWYELYDRSIRHALKEERVQRVYGGLLQMLLGASLNPVPFSMDRGRDLPFDVIDSDKSSSLKDILQFIASGPPKLGLF